MPYHDDSRSQGEAILREAAEQVAGIYNVSAEATGRHSAHHVNCIKVYFDPDSPLVIDADVRVPSRFGGSSKATICIATSYGEKTFSSRSFTMRSDGTFNREGIVNAVLQAVAAEKDHADYRASETARCDSTNDALVALLADLGLPHDSITNGRMAQKLGLHRNLTIKNNFRLFEVDMDDPMSLLGLGKSGAKARIRITALNVDELGEVLRDLQASGMLPTNA